MRIKLHIDASLGERKCWWDVQVDNDVLVQDVTRRIVRAFGLECKTRHVVLLLDDFELLPSSCIAGLVKENETIVVAKRKEDKKRKRPDKVIERKRPKVKAHKRRKTPQPSSSSSEEKEAPEEQVITRHVPPGHGKLETKMRNLRKKKQRLAKQLTHHSPVTVPSKETVQQPPPPHIRFDDTPKFAITAVELGDDDYNDDWRHYRVQPITMPCYINQEHDTILESLPVTMNHHQENSDTMNHQETPATLKPLEGLPQVGDTLVFKMLEMSATYTPELSHDKVGTVLGIDDGRLSIRLDEASRHVKQGDGYEYGKFDLEEEEVLLEEVIELSTSELMNARLLIT